jgi:cystathionine beta-lyase/cystathionine gamma-synthase
MQISKANLRTSKILDMNFSTKQVHAGVEPDIQTGSLNTPIFQTTAFVQDSVDQYMEKGFSYSRTSNPTVEALERKLDALDNGNGSTCFATGMAATHAVFNALLKQGDHAIISQVVYGGTFRIAKEIFENYGITFSFIDTSNLQLLEEHIQTNTKFIFTESPANPTLKISDIVAISSLCQKNKMYHIVDSTFMTPYLLRPIDLGADIVIHSTTKFFDGHNATTGGVAICKDKELDQKIKFIRNTSGSIMSPFNAYLTLQGVKTLSLRLDRQCANAKAIATYLEDHPNVANVGYPGLTSFSGHNILKEQASGFGSMLWFELKGGIKEGKQFADNTTVCTLAENLGAVETLITFPAVMTHAYMPEKQRIEMGISNSLIRLSVGIEDVSDLIEDIGTTIDNIYG